MPETFRSVIPWMTASWFASGILYSSIYWWGFGIAIPSFLSLDAAGTYAIVPLVSLIPALLGHLPATLTWRWYPYGGGSNTWYAVATRPYLTLLMLPAYLIIIWWTMYLYDHYLFFLLVPGLIGLALTPLHIHLIDRGVWQAINPVELRAMLLNIAIMLPPCAALLGVNHGAVIRNGGTTLFLGRPVLQDNESRYHYVGYLGEHFVFYVPDTERVVLKRSDGIDTVELSPASSQRD